MPDNDKPGYFKKAAYTLAEVILVIGIIAIIAALTIPQLIQNTNNKELVAGFLKTHSVLSNAFKEAEAVEETKVYKLSSLDEFKTFFEKHLKTQANCDYDVCLADGSKFDYDTTFYQGCTNQAEGSSSALKESCVKLIVDVNGKKGPNTAGKDQYNLWVTRNGIIPEGETDPQTCSMDCGAYVLSYHRLFDNLNPFHYYKPINDCKTQDNGTCSACNDGYHLEDNKCRDIRDVSCSVYEGETCIVCNSSTHYMNGASVCTTLPDNCTSANSGGVCTGCKDGYISDAQGVGCASGYMKNGIPVYRVGSYEVANVGDLDTYKTNTDYTATYCENYPDWGCKDYYESAKEKCEALGMSMPNVSQLTNVYRAWDTKPSGTFWTNEPTSTVPLSERKTCLLWGGGCAGCSTASGYVHDLDGNVIYSNGNPAYKTCGPGSNLTVDFDNGYVCSSRLDEYWGGGTWGVKTLCVK